MKLFKSSSYLDQTTTDNTGYYEISVCNQHAGSGTYTVKGYYTDKFGQNWQDAESFYWNQYTGPWDFEKDLHLVKFEEKK